MRFSFFLLVTFIFIGFVATGADHNYDIKQISSLEGLSENSVNAICVDKIGNIWIGTDFGLNRYDGRKVHNYYNVKTDFFTISNNWVVDVYESNDGRLWILTRAGVCLYEYETDSFIRMPMGSGYQGFGKIIEDLEYIWFFGSANWLYKVRKSDNEIEQMSITTNYLLSNIREIKELNEDYFAFVTIGEGMFLLDKAKLEVKPMFLSKGEYFVGFELTEEGIFVASRTNFYLLSPDGEIINHKPNLYSEINNPIIFGLEYNKEEKSLWLHTDGDGIFIFDHNFDLLGNLKSGKGVDGKLPDNSIRELMFFDTETIFLGTVRAGLTILHKSKFKEFRNLDSSDSGKITNCVNVLIEDGEQNVWLGTDGDGLKKYDIKTESFLNYYHPEIHTITGLVNYTEDYLLVASYLKGLYLFNKKTKQFISIQKHPVLKNIVETGHIRFFEDSKSNIWIASWNKVYYINPRTGHILEPLLNSELTGSFKNPFAYISAFETKSGEIWFCTRDGLICFSINENKFIDQISFSDYIGVRGNVFSVVENNSGQLIFCTNDGLYEYDPSTKGVSNYMENSNHHKRLFQSLYCNSKNQIWAGTSNGLIRIDKNDSTTNILEVNYLGEVGGSEFRHGAILFSSNDLLYLGSNNGFTVFNPDNILFDNSEQGVTISSLSRNGIKENNIVSEQLAFNVKDSCQIEIKYSTTVYKFLFNTYDFLDEKRTQYSYMLENFDEFWNTGSFYETSYSNLSPGEYVFRVKATNRNGIMGNKTTNIYLKILPAWYQTIWFKLSIIALALLSGFLIWQDSLKRAKLKSQLAFEKLEQDKLKEINQMKLRFFTNISHELKTPLTLILAPLEHLVRQKSSPAEIEKLFPFLYRNAKRMNQLIVQLLEFRKAEMSALKLQLQKADLLVDCRDVINHFTHQSEIEGVRLQFKTELQTCTFIYDRDKFFKILFNLLSNALKHTSKGDSIIVEILQLANKEITLKVVDTGTGISQEKLENVFERFYQADDNESGTGIGLAFTKKLVELHKGSITVDSGIGKKTIFTILIPYWRDEISLELETESKFAPIGNEVEVDVQNCNEDDILKPQILVVEDEWELRKYLMQLLCNKYRVLEAKNGEEGINSAIKNLPDLILSDVMMPVMDGYELCEKLKNDLRISHIPLVMLTAKSETEHRLKGYKLGADAYISKPFDNTILLTQLDSVLRNRLLLKERFSHDLNIKAEELSHSNEDEKFLQKAISIVEMNFENSKFNVDDFVAEIGMGRTLVYNKTKAITGKTINEFILHIRMRRASQLLKETNKSVTEIAISCGFSDQTYFSTVFKKQLKLSPTEYRKS